MPKLKPTPFLDTLAKKHHENEIRRKAGVTFYGAKTKNDYKGANPPPWWLGETPSTFENKIGSGTSLKFYERAGHCTIVSHKEYEKAIADFGCDDKRNVDS